MAARVKTLWELGSCWLPEMMKAFGDLTDHLGTERERQVLDSIYESLPSTDFSSHLVERVPGSAVVVELRDVLWSDWGNASPPLSASILIATKAIPMLFQALLFSTAWFAPIFGATWVRLGLPASPRFTERFIAAEIGLRIITRN